MRVTPNYLGAILPILEQNETLYLISHPDPQSNALPPHVGPGIPVYPVQVEGNLRVSYPQLWVSELGLTLLDSEVYQDPVAESLRGTSQGDFWEVNCSRDFDLHHYYLFTDFSEAILKAREIEQSWGDKS